MRNKLQQNQPNPPNRSFQQQTEKQIPVQPPIEETVSDEPSALGLIGTSLTTYIQLLPQIPAAVAARTKGKDLPESFSAKLENLDNTLNSADPDRPLVRGLKKLWRTPDPKPDEMVQQNPSDIPDIQEQIQRPRPKPGTETPEERMARLASQERGDFDATPPVDPDTLRRDRRYSQVGFNTLYVPKAEMKVNRQQTIPIQQPEQTQNRRMTKADAEYLAQQGMYLRRDKTTGQILRAADAKDRKNARPLTQEEAQYIHDVLGPVDLGPMHHVPNPQPAVTEQPIPRDLTRRDIDVLSQHGFEIVPGRGIIYSDQNGNRKIRKVTPREWVHIQNLVGNVNIGNIVETNPQKQQQPIQKKETTPSKVNIVTSVGRRK